MGERPAGLAITIRKINASERFMTVTLGFTGLHWGHTSIRLRKNSFVRGVGRW